MTRNQWLRLALLWIVGIGLRLTLLAVPPLLPQIHRELTLNEKAVGVLTSIPVLLLGIASVGGSLLISRIGARRAAVAGLLLIACGGACRGIGPTEAVLFGMTFVMGLGIAICQPAAPTLIGEWFPRRIGFATAVYVNGLLVGEALPASLTVPFVLPWTGDWERSFAFWSIPALVTAPLLWFAIHAPAPAKRVADEKSSRDKIAWFPDFHDPLVWRLGMMQIGISVLYFALIAYIPDYFARAGRTSLGVLAIATLNTMQLPASFATLFVAQKLAGKRRFFVAVFLASVPGLAFLLTQQPWLVEIGVTLFAVTSAIGLAMIIALPPMLTHQGNVHRLSAGQFTIGYLGSFVLTLLGGALWDATHVAALAFFPVILGAAMVAAGGYGLKVRTSQ